MLKNLCRGMFSLSACLLLANLFLPAISSALTIEKQENPQMECYIQDLLCLPIPEKRTDYNKKELLLLMGKEVPDSLYQSLLKKYGLTEKSITGVDSLKMNLVVANTHGKDPLELSKKINRLYEELEAATNNYYQYEIADQENQILDEYPKSLTGADQALQYSRGEDVLIGMIDGPVDTQHRSLKGKIEQHALVNYNPESIANLLHGTAIAGVLVSKKTQIGIAPSARVYSIAAFQSGHNNHFSSSSALIAQAIDLAIQKKVDILNLSFSGGKDKLVDRMIKKALTAGIRVVAACGNNASKKPRYPAAISDVLAVTAVDHLKRPYKNANTGKYIDVAAPGVGVLTTAPGDRYQLSSGTSLAAANVSGSLALLLAKKKNIGRDILNSTAVDLGAPGHDTRYGDGLINVLSAIREVTR